MRIASVPAGHVYVRHLSDPDVDDGVRRLPDPPVPGAPPGRWWPPPMLEPSWVLAHAGAFDVLHVHFGFDDRTPAQLAALADAVHAAGRALVVTVHDLRNPHHADRAAHDAALDVLVPAADAVLTLTPGAAAEIDRRWGRRAVVVPHPHVVPPERAAAPRPRNAGFEVGMHAKGRANSDPVPVARALAAAVAELPGAHLRVDAPDDEGGRAVASELAGLDVRVHPPFTDDELWDHLAGLDLSVLPYRFGTHSGWLEACHDLGTAVLAPDCGFYAEQAPCLRYTHDDLDASIAVAVRRAYAERPAQRADPVARAAQRTRVAAAHARVYRDVLTRQPAQGGVVTDVRIRVHAPGPPGNGVVRHARLVARLARAHGVHAVDSGADLTHAQFTDRLYGDDIATSAAAFAAWAATAARPLVVTLHDVPGADPDPARDARRTAGYTRVVAACDAVVVSAEHEAAKVARFAERAVTVIDLPLPRPVPGGPRPAWADRPTLGVLGFVHPGKGHGDVIDAAAGTGLRVVAAGGPAPGHDELVRALHRGAERRGVELVVTGPLGEAEMTAAARAVTVPVAPGAAVSASGSLMTWLGSGRRPLAARGEYAVELDRRLPGAVALYADAAALPSAVRRALADPVRTRLDRTPQVTDAGAAHAALYRRLLAC